LFIISVIMYVMLFMHRTLWLMLSHSLVSQERFHTLLVESLSSGSSAASTSSVKHQAAEIIRKANLGGSSTKHGHFTSGQKVLLCPEAFLDFPCLVLF
jgi:hypothetical protein